MTYTFSEMTISDLHKDARGTRPGEDWRIAWANSSDDEKQKEWDSLIKELDESLDEEAKIQEQALSKLKQLLSDTRALGAPDDVTALVWIMEGEEFTEFDCMYGPDYFCWSFGLSYSEKDNFPIAEAMNNLMKKIGKNEDNSYQ